MQRLACQGSCHAGFQAVFECQQGLNVSSAAFAKACSCVLISPAPTGTSPAPNSPTMGEGGTGGAAPVPLTTGSSNAALKSSAPGIAYYVVYTVS